MSIQKELFYQIKKRLPDHLSMVDEIAELFNVSNDSAYRRIRGDTSMSFEEIGLLSKRFNISIDSVLGKQITNRVSFKYDPIHEANFTLAEHFKFIITILADINSSENGQVIYAANEAKFGLFHVPEVAAFKLFFWMKTSYDFEKYKPRKFSFEQFKEDHGELINTIVENYVKVPTIEIINSNYLNSTLNQIKFYYESGYFNSKAEALMVCDKLKELIDHNRREAELGYKFKIGRPEVGKEGNLMLYHNEVIHSDNVISSKIDQQYFCFLIINTINFMSTGNQKFSKDTYDYLLNLRNKSTLISVSAERERNIFYNELTDKIATVKNNL